MKAVVLCLCLLGAGAPSAALAKPTKAVEAVEAPPTVTHMAGWVVRSGDNDDMPFVIVDKAAAMVFVYDAAGKMLGATPALIGTTPGDDAVPGIGDRELSDIPVEDRTTPAGRFLGGYGPAHDGRQVLWVDYATAISLHPVVTSNPAEKRLQRLKSPAVDDNRITYGCINVSRAFYNKVVRPTLKNAKGVFYILPDTKDLAEVFPSFWQSEFAYRAGAAPVSSAPPEPRRPSGRS